MPDTFVKIATVTVGSGGAASMDFSSIPSTYTDLILYWTGRGTVVNYDVNISFNSSTASFTSRRIYGDGSTVSSDTGATRFAGFESASSFTASTFGNCSVYIPNYAGSTNKSFSVDGVNETNATSAYAALAAGLWSNTAAINAISLSPGSGNFAQYSTATLYGISKT